MNGALRPPILGQPPVPLTGASHPDSSAARVADAQAPQVTLIAPAVREAVAKIKVKDPSLGELGNVLAIMSTSMDESRLEAASQRLVIAGHGVQLTDHESRIAILERKVETLTTTVEATREEAAFSMCIASNVEPYDLVFCGLPGSTREEVAPLIVAVGSALGVNLDEGCVVGVRRGKRQAGVAREPDLFVSLRFSLLRTTLLNNLRTRKILRQCDLENGLQSEERIFIYEVLSGPRMALFSSIRKEAERLGYRKPWHKDGVIFVRKTADSRPRRVNSLEELAVLKD